MKILSKKPLCFSVTLEEIEGNNCKLSPNSYIRVKKRGVSEEDLLSTIKYLEGLKK